jgi:putative ABC transport system permease protein
MPVILPALRVAAATLRSNPLRTFLSTLGVIIGVAALVAVLSVGDGVEAFARAQIERTTDLQSIGIRPRFQDDVDGILVPRSDVLQLTMGLRDSLARELGARADVTIAGAGASRVAGGTIQGESAALIYGIMAEAAPIRIPDLVGGRRFTAGEATQGNAVTVVSEGLGKLLSGGDPLAALDQSVTLNGVAFSVIGIAKDEEGDKRRHAFVPYGVLARVTGGTAMPGPRSLSIIDIRVKDATEIAAVRERVERLLTGWLGKPGDRYAIDSYTPDRLKQLRQGILLFKLTMGTFAGIAVLVGGIGIMNVLLSAVIERTREIGIRKACGATNRDVLLQFLTESVAITGAGAVAGTILGLAGAFGATAVMRRMTEAEVHAAVTLSSLLAAAAVAVVTGIAFGTYPALRASRLSPVDAMRNE